jgi:tRNA-dihydrouridine synthase
MAKKNFWQKLPKPFFALAPMDEVTDAVFVKFWSSMVSPM